MQDFLAKDGCVDIILLIWLNRNMFVLKSSECTLVKNRRATDKTSKSENFAKQISLKSDFFDAHASAVCYKLFNSADNMILLLCSGP